MEPSEHGESVKTENAPLSSLNGTLRLLVIEDDPAYSRLLCIRLEKIQKPHLSATAVHSLTAAVERLEREPFDAALLDLTLPDSSGLDSFRRLHVRFPQVPVIVLSGFDDEALALECVRSGAQEYLVKGRFEPWMLARLIVFSIERHRQQTKLVALSITDELTGLYNRRGFMELAGHQLKVAERSERELLLFFGDLDSFKSINDQFGHAAGDQALIRTAQIFKETFRASDLIARIGGDEFTVLALEASQAHAGLLMARLRENLKKFNERQVLPFELSLSVGSTCFYPKQSTRLDILLNQADQALYEEKERKAKTDQPEPGSGVI